MAITYQETDPYIYNPYSGFNTTRDPSLFDTDLSQPALGALRQNYSDFYSPRASRSAEDSFLSGRLDSWEKARGQLGQQYQTFDQPAKAQVNDLNKKTEAIYKAYKEGRVRRDEYLKAINSIYDEAEEYKWQYHVNEPGSQVGDITDDNGVQKIKTEKGVEILGYTPDYIKNNTIQVGEDSLAVPTSPKAGYQIVPRGNGAERNFSDEQKGTEDAYKKITERYEKIRESRLPGKEVKDEEDNVIGYQPFSPEEEAEMSIQAGQLYVKQYLQAKHAQKLISDSGITDPSKTVLKGETYDPFVTDYQDALKRRMATGAAPTPSPGPVPGQGQQPPAGPWSNIRRPISAEDDLRTDIQEAIRSRKVSAAASAAMRQEGAVVRTKEWGPQMLIEAAAMDRPAIAYSKDELKTTFKNAADGTVAELPDGRRYVKDKGKFWEVPYSKAHTEAITQQRETRFDQVYNDAVDAYRDSQDKAEDVARKKGTKSKEYAAAVAQVRIDQDYAQAIDRQRQPKESQQDIVAQAMRQIESGTPGGFVENPFIQQADEQAVETRGVSRPTSGLAARQKRTEPSIDTTLENWESNEQLRGKVERPIVANTPQDAESAPVGSVVSIRGVLYYKSSTSELAKIPPRKIGLKKKGGLKKKKPPSEIPFVSVFNM